MAWKYYITIVLWYFIVHNDNYENIEDTKIQVKAINLKYMNKVI